MHQLGAIQMPVTDYYAAKYWETAEVYILDRQLAVYGHRLNVNRPKSEQV